MDDTDGSLVSQIGGINAAHYLIVEGKLDLSFMC